MSRVCPRKIEKRQFNRPKDGKMLKIFQKNPLQNGKDGAIIPLTVRFDDEREGRAPLFFECFTKGGKGVKVTELVAEFAKPVIEANGCSLWDVEYVREGSERYLRIYLDKEGGIDIDDCEKIHRAIDPILDEKDPIAESYHFEVCSAGIERVLKKPENFRQFMGSPVLVKLYRPRNGLKELPGVLRGYEDGRITVEAGKETVTFEKSEVALVRLRVEF